jgi:hypothetical protein
MEVSNGGLLIAAMALHATGADSLRPAVSDDTFLKRLPASLDQESGFQVAREREPQPDGINRQVEEVDLRRTSPSWALAVLGARAKHARELWSCR